MLASNRIVHNLGPGERGVLWSRFGGGTVLDRTYPEGIRLILPWDRMYVYNVRVQELHDSVVVLSSNGLPITVTYSCRYHPFANTLPNLHQQYGPTYADTLVKPEVISALRGVIGNYRPEDIYARDEAGLLDEIFTALQANLTNHDVVVQDILIKELRLTAEIEAAINQKLVQEQQSLAYEFRLEDRRSRAAAEDDRGAGNPVVRGHLAHLDAQVARHRGDPGARQVPELEGDRRRPRRESDADHSRRQIRKAHGSAQAA